MADAPVCLLAMQLLQYFHIMSSPNFAASTDIITFTHSFTLHIPDIYSMVWLVWLQRWIRSFHHS